MQFAVPQFTDVEDKLIGSLTLKQFLVLLATGGLVLFFWTVLGPNIIFFLLALPFSIAGIGVALGRYNGRPMFTYLVPFASYMGSNKVMIFKREPTIISVSKAELKQEKTIANPEDLEPAESRLKKLAYMLDRKTEEEKEIISKDDMNIIHATSMPRIDLNQVLSRAKADIIATAKKLDAGIGSTKPVAKQAAPAKESVARSVTSMPTAKIVAAPVPQTRSVPAKKSAKKSESKQKKFDPSSFLN